MPFFRNIRNRQVSVVMLVLVLLILTLSGNIVAATGKNDPLQLFVAAGMKKPMDKIIEKFQAEKGIKVVPNYASSGGLWAQIRQGQPCDLFYTAD